jgi:2-amino-4-hydroxy-6-hydroxymethyldihydropteridine diphosphokinase
MISVFLLLGSNMGNRHLFLEMAVAEIEKLVGTVLKKSAVYETLAWGKTDEPDYLNQVLCIETAMEPQAVLRTVLNIEKELGRERKEKWGSRIIDIDILFYGNQIINEPDLIIPHPYLHQRKFTLAPMAEIAPGFMHPVLMKTIADLNLSLDS